MKKRPAGFLAPYYDEAADEHAEVGDYIAELHDYLWRVVRVIFPHAQGELGRWLDWAVEKLEGKTL